MSPGGLQPCLLPCTSVHLPLHVTVDTWSLLLCLSFPFCRMERLPHGIISRLGHMPSVLTSWSCHDKCPQTGNLKTTEMYSLSPGGQESKIKVSAGSAPPGAPEGRSVLRALPASGGCWLSLVCLGLQTTPPHGIFCVSSLHIRTPVVGSGSA